jgi:hypothetical protein
MPFSTATLSFEGRDARVRCTIEWGDGITSELAACDEAFLRAAAHTYSGPDAYVVRLTATSLGYGMKARSIIRLDVE